eukprot:XP_024446983.1 QWRF motif-containing protein 3 [Populus trichocarpa]
MGLDLFKDKKSLSSSSLLSGSGNVENIHQPRRLHVRLMQWRYANDRADTKQVEIKLLEALGDMERQDLSPASKTKECSLSVIRRAPLMECAKVDPVLLAIQHASDLSASIKVNNVYIFTLSKQQLLKQYCAVLSHQAEQTVGLQSQLAEVAAQEKLLIEECLELLQTVSILQLES